MKDILVQELDCITPEYPYGLELFYYSPLKNKVIYQIEFWGKIFKDDLFLEIIEI